MASSKPLMAAYEALKGDMDPAQEVLLLTMISQLDVAEQLLEAVNELRQEIKRSGWK